MNKQAHKCRHCKKAMPGASINKKFCSNRCKQADWRKRHPTPKREKKAVERVLAVATCEHCEGDFFRATPRGRFCSTSCRSLYHRAMRAAIPAALAAAYPVPMGTTLDLLERMPIARVKALLTDKGYVYEHQRRAWVQGLEMVQA